MINSSFKRAVKPPQQGRAQPQQGQPQPQQTQIALPGGSRLSIHNGQLLISTGVETLDDLLGSGLPVGSVVLLEQDEYTDYHSVLMKYYLAEGVACGHAIHLANLDADPKSLISSLPGLYTGKGGSGGSGEGGAGPKDKLDIAWRYQNLPQHHAEKRKAGGDALLKHTFDLTTVLSKEQLDQADIQLFNGVGADGDSPYDQLLADLEKRIKNGYSTKPGEQSTVNGKLNIFRIGLVSLGSPYWNSNSNSGVELFRFLLKLRALVRYSLATCVISFPAFLHTSSAEQGGTTAYMTQIRSMVDAVMTIESFSGSSKEANPAFQDYHGLFHVHKLLRLNSLQSHKPETLQFAFKLSRKRFTIEKLHLPPELETSQQREQDDIVPLRNSPSSGCAPGITKKSSKLDF